MSWRTIIIANSAKLDYKMDCMVVRQEQITKIYLNEIYMLVIESTAVSITASLMAELMKRKIKVIFCDEKRNPAGGNLPICRGTCQRAPASGSGYLKCSFRLQNPGAG